MAFLDAQILMNLADRAYLAKVNERERMAVQRPTMGFTTPQPYYCLQHLGVSGFDTGMFEKSKRCLIKPAVQRVLRTPFANIVFGCLSQ